MFLVPAIVALTSDVLILWLNRLGPRENKGFDNDEENFAYHVRYLVPLAVIRIFLLSLPLLFHSYTGTAVQCPSLYRILYWGTLLFVVAHILALCMVNPNSLQAIFPIEGHWKLEHLHELRRIWWILLCSLSADISHLVIFGHVKSSAPYADYYYPYLWSPSASSASARKHPSVYYALRTGSMNTPQNTQQQQQQQQFDNGIFNYPDVNMSNPLYNDTEPEPALMNAMNDILIDVRVRLQRAKSEWSARLDDFTRRHLGADQANNAISRASPSPAVHFKAPLSPFRVLLQLFAYEDVLENGKLSAVFDMDDGAAITFFVPQLLSFLLHGALYCSPQLEDWILDRCRRNVYFAHRCFWFLRAWCLQIPCESNSLVGGSETPLSMNSRQNSEVALAPFLDEPSSPSKVLVDCGGVVSLGRSISSGRLPDASNFLPEERQMIHRLLQRVKECGEEASQVLMFGMARVRKSPGIRTPKRRGGQRLRGRTPDSTRDTASIFFASSDDEEEDEEGSLPEDEVEYFPEGSRFPKTTSGLESATQTGAIPSDPSDMSPSMSHFKVVSSSKRFGFLPIQNDEDTGDSDGEMLHMDSSPSASPTHSSATELFDKAPAFLDALLHLADELFLVPRERRKTVLRHRLRALECQMLPSNTVYLPLGWMRHRVWRIVANESIALSTKERVPCIVYLEVVDFAAAESANGGKWQNGWGGLLGRLPMPRKRRAQSLDTTHTGSDVVPHPASAHDFGEPEIPTPSPLRQRPLSSTSTDGDRGQSHLLTEADMIKQWREAPRNPQRRTSLFTKVSTTVQNNVQVVQDHLNQYRDRSVSEELQYLTLAESLVGVTAGSEPLTETTDVSPSNGTDDLEAGIGSNGSTSAHRLDKDPQTAVAAAPISGNSIISRASSGASLVSMGQWSSPSHVHDKSQRRTKNRHKSGRNSGIIDRRENGAVLLRYGSDTSETDEDTRSRPSLKSDHISVNALALSTTDVSGEGKSKKGPSRPPPVVFREDFKAKQERIRAESAYGSHPGWRLLPVLVKANDDLRQEQLASQLIYRMASILAREKVPVWLCNYEIIALTESGGIIEAIPDTISLDSLKKNDPKNTTLREFFHSRFEPGEELADAKANFVESLAAYSMVCFLLQIKDRHNGNILLDNRGHLIHIDFGFFFLSSPGKNAGFESAPFKLTRDFVELLDGPNSHLFRSFRELCVKTFIALRRHCMELILLVEMLKNGNEELKCFRGRPDEAIKQLRARFRLDLNDRACREYVNALVDDSIENWRTDWYDRYQRYFVGVL